jgi:hypothetical protein
MLRVLTNFPQIQITRLESNKIINYLNQVFLVFYFICFSSYSVLFRRLSTQLVIQSLKKGMKIIQPTGVSMPGNLEAMESMQVLDSPPKFRVNTESGSGVNFSRLPCKRCFLFLSSPTSGIFFHSSTYNLRHDMIKENNISEPSNGNIYIHTAHNSLYLRSLNCC